MALSRVTNPTDSVTTLLAADWKAEFDQIYNNSLGLISPLTGNLAAGSNKITGLAAATANGDAVRYEQVTPAVSSAMGMQFISAVSAAASATVDFTSGLSSTYNMYVVTITDLIPATDNTDLWMRVSQAAVFLSGASDYRWSRMQCSDAGSVTGAGSTGDTKLIIANALGNGAGETYSGLIRLSNPAGAVKNKLVHAHSTWYTSSPTIATGDMTGAFVLNTTAIDGVRFMMSSGNITSGEFALYGIRKS